MKKLNPQPTCPECEKLSKVSEEFNKIGAFLDWLSEKEIVLCRWEANDDENTREYLDDVLLPIRKYRGYSGIEQLLADYFEIDLEKVEKERKHLLAWIQGQS